MKTILLFTASLLLSFTITAQAKIKLRPADELLGNAYKEAAATNKNVLVIFHASWCGWCRKIDSSINDTSCKELFDKNYVIVHLTVQESKDKKALETPGAAAFMAKYNGTDAGLPFFLIMDKNGNLLADSKIRKDGAILDQPGDNMGCPSADDEVVYFTKILKQTSSLTDDELKIIASRFSKNKPH